MTDTWYYTAGGQQNGPVSGTDLRELLASGKIMVGVDERKRGWHDQIAGTLVVTRNSLMTWG